MKSRIRKECRRSKRKSGINKRSNKTYYKCNRVQEPDESEIKQPKRENEYHLKNEYTKQ